MAEVSIIIPVFRSGEYLRRALNSCVAQSFSDIEIICVDDCGGDDSMDIAREFMTRDKRVKIFTNERNLGPFHSRLNGAKIAKSPWLFMLDADDFIDEKTCEILLNAAKNAQIATKTRPDFVCFNINFEYHPNEEYQIMGPVSYDENYDITGFLGLLLKSGRYYFWNIFSKLYTREIFLKSAEIFGDDALGLNMAEDVLRFWEIVRLAKSVACVGEALYYYFCNPASATHDKSEVALDKAAKDLAFVRDFIKDHGNLATSCDGRLWRDWCDLIINTLDFNIFKDCEYRKKPKNRLEKIQKERIFAKKHAKFKSVEKSIVGKYKIDY